MNRSLTTEAVTTTNPTTSPRGEIDVDGLTVRFGATRAVDRLSCRFPAGAITGLLGRNGAGKSTLLRAIAGHVRPDAGRLAVDGLEPFEGPLVMADTVLVAEGGRADEESFKGLTDLAGTYRPRWDAAYADELAHRFAIPRTKRLDKLSKGQAAAARIVIGLASRCAVTIFDEPHTGLDAANRYAFYDELLADYARFPRTIILSTHIIEEISKLIEHVVIIDSGRLLLQSATADLMARGAEVTGPAADVDAVTFGRQVLSERTLGATKQAVIYGELNGLFARRAAEAGVDVGPLPLQDLFVHLTTSTERTADQ